MPTHGIGLLNANEQLRGKDSPDGSDHTQKPGSTIPATILWSQRFFQALLGVGWELRVGYFADFFRELM
jgi:hypothetical protein